MDLIARIAVIAVVALLAPCVARAQGGILPSGILPLHQYPVGREFNRRVYLALQSHGIGIGIPQEIERAEASSRA